GPAVGIGEPLAERAVRLGGHGVIVTVVSKEESPGRETGAFGLSGESEVAATAAEVTPATEVATTAAVIATTVIAPAAQLAPDPAAPTAAVPAAAVPATASGKGTDQSHDEPDAEQDAQTQADPAADAHTLFPRCGRLGVRRRRAVSVDDLGSLHVVNH